MGLRLASALGAGCSALAARSLVCFLLVVYPSSVVVNVVIFGEDLLARRPGRQNGSSACTRCYTGRGLFRHSTKEILHSTFATYQVSKIHRSPANSSLVSLLETVAWRSRAEIYQARGVTSVIQQPGVHLHALCHAAHGGIPRLSEP